MRTGRRSFTLVECIFLVVVLGTVVLLATLMMQRSLAEARKKACEDNLKLIGRAFYSYTQSASEYFPFSEMPADESAPRRKDAMTSIATVYPQYLYNARVFRCPSTNHRPTFRVNTPMAAHGTRSSPTNTPYAFSNRNYTLLDSSYGYDCRLYPSAYANHVMVADMDGSGPPTQNHKGGQHILYVDGRVAWCATNFASNDPRDNIFAEDPWHADTDSFISDNTSWRTPGSKAADQYNDLTVSYDGYPDLWPPK